MDFDATYKVEGYGGVAWRVTGYTTEIVVDWDFDNEAEIENTSMVEAHMVGDDRTFTFDVDDLTVIDKEDYCPECGQIGCNANG